MFKPGAILKITVKNFVTYTYAELYPGPNLNMLIGPNGTGKSTIVAAIILGLGGNPKIVGRGTKLSEYVKHGCDEAVIDIVIQGENEGETHKITREFNIHLDNVWRINGRKVSPKDLYHYVEQYNIQVDNLCQFLPQDRVQDFAKMNKQELLKQTQAALCRDELLKKQEKLITRRERHKNLISTLEGKNKKLQDLRDANIRLEGKVTNFKKKKKYLENIKHIERKEAWVNFELLQEKREEVKADRNKAQEIYDKHKNSAKPIENAVTNAKKEVSNLQSRLNVLQNTIHKAESNLEDKLEATKQFKHIIKRIEADKNMKLREIEDRKEEINASTLKLEALIQNKQEIINKFGSDDEVHQKLTKCQSEIKEINFAIRAYEEKRIKVHNSLREKQYEIQSLENEIRRIENVKQQKLEWLRRSNEHAYNATLWLRDNKHLFNGEIFEPMMLELNVINPNHAIYIENTVPKRDLVAFTCTRKEDMNKLIRVLREEKELQINVVHSGGEDSFQHYQPKIPIEQLKKYGLYSYLHSLMTGPDAIMKYLCKNYGIHNIPVGTNATNNCYESVPQQITNFFSDKYKFSTSYSKYTGEKSTRQSEIKPSGSLSISVNATHLNEIKGQIAQIQATCTQETDQINTFVEKIESLNERIRNHKSYIGSLQTSRQQVNQIEGRITTLRARIDQMKQDNINIEDIDMDASRKIQTITNKTIEALNESKDLFASYGKLKSEYKLRKLIVDTTRKQVVFLENQAVDVRQQIEEAETSLNTIREVYSKIMQDTKAAFKAAKDLSKGCTPDDEGFNEFRDIFEKLPGDLEQLDAEKEHIQTKIDCLSSAGMGEVDEYENRLLEINTLEEDITNSNREIAEITENMDKLRDEWLDPLNSLINEINKRFGDAFERMGCAGEVSLYKGNNENDFQDYGISIKVTYRNGEPLQELNTITQSGGERAVATATYMLSLQELTPVPFRCVDEINQGMDANNERRIFELLVDCTSQKDTSQYFLITPKLIPNLKFVPTMKIHVVYNGPFVCNQEKWNTHKKSQRNLAPVVF